MSTTQDLTITREQIEELLKWWTVFIADSRSWFDLTMKYEPATDTRWTPLDQRGLTTQIFYIFETYINWNKTDALKLIREILDRNPDGADEILNQLSVYKQDFQNQFLSYIFKHI